MTYAFGIDLSKYQCSHGNDSKLVDFDAIAAHSEKVSFIFARASLRTDMSTRVMPTTRRRRRGLALPSGHTITATLPRLTRSRWQPFWAL